MQHVFVYGDSLSWGIIPDTRRRLAFAERWPGVMEGRLGELGIAARIVEDCLNGRRTVWDDPFKAGRNGLIGLAQKIEASSPLALVVLMLGTNDFQSMHDHNAWHSAQGVAALVREIRAAPLEPGMPVPPILVVAPPPFGEPRGAIAAKFAGAGRKAEGLSEALAALSAELGCPFFDAAAVATSSAVDGVHIDVAQHLVLGRALGDRVAALLRG